MPQTLFLSLLVLGLGVNACAKDSKSGNSTNGKDTQTEKAKLVADSPILGEWSICLPFDGEDDSNFPVLPISSGLRSINFNEEGKGLRSFAYFKDDSCKEAFSAADLSIYMIAVEKWFLDQGFPELPEDVRNDLTKALTPKQDGFQFRLGNPTAPQGTLDILREDGQSEFTIYRINGRWLQLAETCLPDEIGDDDKPDCTAPLGESPSHRPTEYNLFFLKGEGAGS